MNIFYEFYYTSGLGYVMTNSPLLQAYYHKFYKVYYINVYFLFTCMKIT